MHVLFERATTFYIFNYLKNCLHFTICRLNLTQQYAMVRWRHWFCWISIYPKRRTCRRSHDKLNTQFSLNRRQIGMKKFLIDTDFTVFWVPTSQHNIVLRIRHVTTRQASMECENRILQLALWTQSNFMIVFNIAYVSNRHILHISFLCTLCLFFIYNKFFFILFWIVLIVVCILRSALSIVNALPSRVGRVQWLFSLSHFHFQFH